MHYDARLYDHLQNNYDVVVPSAMMLEKALGVNRVHIFGDISKGQLFEKTDWLTENANAEGK